MTRPQARAAAHMSALLVRLVGDVGVVGFGEELVTAVPSVIGMRSRPPEGGCGASAYDVEAQGRVHGCERIVNR